MLVGYKAEGWVLKKPTSQGTKPWATSALQKRYLETHAHAVAYFAEEGAKRPPGMKPRGTFDLRDVSMLRESLDPTAPGTAVELTVRKHAFTLSFKSDFERDRFLRLWINAVPEAAVPRELFAQFHDSTLAAELLSLAEASPARSPSRRSVTTAAASESSAASLGPSMAPALAPTLAPALAPPLSDVNARTRERARKELFEAAPPRGGLNEEVYTEDSAVIRL